MQGLPTEGPWAEEGSASRPKPVRWAYKAREVPIVMRAYERPELGSRTKLAGRLHECLLYPLLDGPGVGLLLFAPPLLMWMSIPLLDIIAVLAPRGQFNALALLIVPFTLPLDLCFALTLGYILIFLGQMMVASALGENDHPHWPEWDLHRIAEGLARWVWSGIIGLAIGGLPMLLYWLRCGDLDVVDWLVFAGLMIVGVGYAQMILAASLLHDNLWAANPLAAVAAIGRVGLAYLLPCVVSVAGVTATGSVLFLVLFRSVSMTLAAFGLWVFWLMGLYVGMVAVRVLGVSCFKHAEALGWVRGRPKWAVSSRTGHIYVNS